MKVYSNSLKFIVIGELTIHILFCHRFVPPARFLNSWLRSFSLLNLITT